jgi:hypothetical protein
MRAIGVFVLVLGCVSLLTQQYWLLPAGLAVAALGLLLTSR